MREKFIEIIKGTSLEMAKKWAMLVSKSEYTRTYRKLSEEELVKISKHVYDNLGRWLVPGASQEEMGRNYAKIGAKRYEQGYPLCDLYYAFHFTKKVLLNHIFSGSVMPDTLKLYQIFDFIQEIYDFFDLAAFYETRGYLEVLYKKMLSFKGVDKDKLKAVFPEGSFYYEREPDFRSFEKALEGFNLFRVTK